MARHFSLQIIYDLARKRVETCSRTVKQAHGRWLRARAQIVRLQTERSRYVEVLARQRGNGDAGFYPAAVEGWKTLAARLTRSRQELDATHAEWQQALQAWQEQEKRLQALTVLLRRHRDQVSKRDAVRERKVHDEISARNFIASRQETTSGLAWEEHLS
ncbi:MAG: flagellar FliJ family protein [Thiobacillaceae bacterium]|jgi:flagellar export protein FliJ